MITGRAMRNAAVRAGERVWLRETRDLAICALYGAGLSTYEISALRLCDVQNFPSGKVSVRLRRGAKPPRYVVVDGRPAKQIARHVESHASHQGAARVLPLFAGRVAGAALTRQHVLRVLRDQQDPVDRRERS